MSVQAIKQASEAAKRTILTMFLVGIVLIAVPVRAAPRSASDSKDRIAFVAFYDDRPVSQKINIMTINPDGSDVQQLFSMENHYEIGMFGCGCAFMWAPDYKHLLFFAPFYAPTSTFIIRTDGQGEKTYGSDYYQFKWSPDGLFLAFLYHKDRKFNNYEGTLYIADADGANPHPFTDRAVTDFDWSPDGKQLALSSRGDIFVAPIEGGAKLKRLATNDLNADTIYWSPDGTKISFVYRSALYLLDVKTQVRRKISDWVSYNGYAWSPDGRQILVNDALVDIQNGSHRPLPYPTNFNDYGTLKWSPDSSRLLYGKPEDNIPGWLFTWDLSAHNPIPLNLPADNEDGYGIRDGVWSPDSSQIAYLLDRQICIINVDNTGHHCISEADQYGQIGRLQWAHESGLRRSR